MGGEEEGSERSIRGGKIKQVEGRGRLTHEGGERKMMQGEGGREV